MYPIPPNPMASFSQELVKRLANASAAMALTGAGISAESGVPTFRDPGGLWEEFSPQELANVDAFLDNPKLVQGWYAHRHAVVSDVEPNPGHYALAALEDLLPSFTVITQNVDGLHREAGSQDVAELHGNIRRAYCIDCETPAPEGALSPDADEIATCPACGGLVRPDVVWFGEMLPREAIGRAEAAVARADVCLSIGTSALVYPAAGIPQQARAHGAYVAEINIEPSAIADQIDETVIGKAGDVLPALVEAVRAAHASGSTAS